MEDYKKFFAQNIEGYMAEFSKGNFDNAIKFGSAIEIMGKQLVSDAWNSALEVNSPT